MPDLISNEIFRNRSGLRRTDDSTRRMTLSEKESESVNPNLRVAVAAAAAVATKPRETMVGITAAEAVNEIKI